MSQAKSNFHTWESIWLSTEVHTSVTPALERLRQQGHEFMTELHSKNLSQKKKIKTVITQVFCILKLI
jgi:hypothetical protein